MEPKVPEGYTTPEAATPLYESKVLCGSLTECGDTLSVGRPRGDWLPRRYDLSPPVGSSTIGWSRPVDCGCGGSEENMLCHIERPCADNAFSVGKL
jgi:hypothetical protein